jgi:hypothetical protein
MIVMSALHSRRLRWRQSRMPRIHMQKSSYLMPPHAVERPLGRVSKHEAAWIGDLRPSFETRATARSSG